jgi:4-diphosphocytidyl-2-C-methyl-D-erythritol kinase
MSEARRIVHAHAKVNLTLEVLGKRPDGYHEIRSVMRTLALHDIIHVEPADKIAVVCDLPGLDGEANLAYRAALLLQREIGYAGGARIDIEKAIPMAAGLGGGSSDAAATLVALNQLWAAGQSLEALSALAARLGSDVPFFLYGGMALASGRGERVTPLPPLRDCTVLLVRPPVAVSTATIYGQVTPAGYSDGSASARLAALPATAPPSEWPLVNGLQAITCRAYPIVAEALSLLKEGGALQALLCGSGAACFGLFAAPNQAEAVAAAARARGWDAWITHFL